MGQNKKYSRPMIFSQKTREFRDQIRLKIEVKLKKLKVQRSINNQIIEIQNQRSLRKRRANSGIKFD
jgi:hypothetical protein